MHGQPAAISLSPALRCDARAVQDPSLVARAEVKFWKTELDRCVQEKQHWIARAENVSAQP